MVTFGLKFSRAVWFFCFCFIFIAVRQKRENKVKLIYKNFQPKISLNRNILNDHWENELPHTERNALLNPCWNFVRSGLPPVTDISSFASRYDPSCIFFRHGWGIQPTPKVKLGLDVSLIQYPDRIYPNAFIRRGVNILGIVSTLGKQGGSKVVMNVNFSNPQNPIKQKSLHRKNYFTHHHSVPHPLSLWRWGIRRRYFSLKTWRYQATLLSDTN